MKDEKELGRALKEEKDMIVVEGDLVHKVIKIKMIGKAAWPICIGGITIAITVTITNASTAGAATPIAVPSALVGASGAVATLGVPTTIAAIGIAVAGGGVAVLNKLRRYRMEKISATKIILHKK